MLHKTCLQEFYLLGYSAIESGESRRHFGGAYQLLFRVKYYVRQYLLHVGFLLSLFSNTEDGGVKFLENVRWLPTEVGPLITTTLRTSAPTSSHILEFTIITILGGSNKLLYYAFLSSLSFMSR
jgi:hypothetical protein